MKKAVQYFSSDYLDQCRSMKPDQILEFLEGFRLLHLGDRTSGKGKSKLISLKVPESLLATFRAQSKLRGIPYQTQIKKLMEEWALKPT